MTLAINVPATGAYSLASLRSAGQARWPWCPAQQAGDRFRVHGIEDLNDSDSRTGSELAELVEHEPRSHLTPGPAFGCLLTIVLL